VFEIGRFKFIGEYAGMIKGKVERGERQTRAEK